MVSSVLRAGGRVEQGVFLPGFGYERIPMSLSLHEEVLGLALWGDLTQGSMGRSCFMLAESLGLGGERSI